MTPITVEVSVGELADKISILEIKRARLTVPAQLDNVRSELATLRTAWQAAGVNSEALQELCAQLKDVNVTLWNIEDDIRQHESRQDFGPSFVALARRVYITNDKRAALKRDINVLAGSRLFEEKSYANYQAPTDR
ncbi:MAG: DUF6165 family protein [Pseudomonadota bacterium]